MTRRCERLVTYFVVEIRSMLRLLGDAATSTRLKRPSPCPRGLSRSSHGNLHQRGGARSGARISTGRRGNTPIPASLRCTSKSAIGVTPSRASSSASAAVTTPSSTRGRWRLRAAIELLPCCLVVERVLRRHECACAAPIPMQLHAEGQLRVRRLETFLCGKKNSSIGSVTHSNEMRM
jgi:hypothetical protein